MFFLVVIFSITTSDESVGSDIISWLTYCNNSLNGGLFAGSGSYKKHLLLIVSFCLMIYGFIPRCKYISDNAALIVFIGKFFEKFCLLYV